ncbi:heat shock factor family protein [Sporobolomyces koalae]|uniref:heat shock factor family protein n=1 Tax=Sporobolomyces koalae TaxID=500713 RepID=UPI00317C61C5
MTTTASIPNFPCPYTTSGCPLFNTIEVQKPQSPTCGGGCSPPAVSESNPLRPLDPSLKLPLIASTQSRAPSPIRLPLASNPLSPLPPASLASSREWNGYLDFGLQPSEVDLASLYVPLPSGQSTPLKRVDLDEGVWDIEELVPGPRAKKTKFGDSLSSEIPRSIRTPIPISGTPAPYPLSVLSPTSDDGASEVVTPFISKLCFLLEHQEYQPWVRWDVSGTHILIAHTKPRLLEILAKYFRHTTIASFVRQLNIYGFKRVSTVSLLSILESSSLPESGAFRDSAPDEVFSASDHSAFHHPAFFRSLPGGPRCRLGTLKPITKERTPRSRSKKPRATKAKVLAESDEPQ